MAQHEDGTPYEVLLIDDDAEVGDVVLAIGQFFDRDAAIAAVFPDSTCASPLAPS